MRSLSPWLFVIPLAQSAFRGPRTLDVNGTRRIQSEPEPYLGNAVWPLDQGCNGYMGTCGMAECVTPSTKPTCIVADDQNPNYDVTSQTAKITCQTCTQELSDPRCTTAALIDVIHATGGIKAAYCNNRNLVIVSNGAPSHTPDLENIVVPPGANIDGVACVTRSWAPRFDVFKIPLLGKYTLLETASRYNNANTNAFPGGSTKGANGYLYSNLWGTFGLSYSTIGVTVAGQTIYPVFSDTVVLTPQSCEVDSCNEHVGQGGGAPHLHGDPFHKTPGKCLYSAENYSSLEAHPPVIGWSLDGPTIYGRYLSTTAPGFGTLDACGGHKHDSYEYHYHAQVKPGAANQQNKAGASVGTEFPAFPPGPDECWKADLTSIEGFRSTEAPDRNPYYQPCCGMTNYWVAHGYGINGAGAQDASGATQSPSPTPAASPITSPTVSSTPLPTLSLTPGIAAGTRRNSPCVYTWAAASGAFIYLGTLRFRL